MSIFGDVHNLTEGLKVVDRLTNATVELTRSCQELNANIVKLTAVLEELKKTQKPKIRTNKYKE